MVENNTITIGSSSLSQITSPPINSDENIKQKPTYLVNRNIYGLLESNKINYIYHEDGTINWRKMVKAEYLVPNRQRTQETDVSKLEDKDLLILLGGIKELAQIRGYSKVEYKVVAAAENYFATSCRITWVPNYETEGREIIFESLADASINNTKSFARFFLAAIAENRAFVRCVRNFLKINIVGQEELGDVKIIEDDNQINQTSPHAVLDKIMKEKNINFDTLKAKLIKEKFENSENISNILDIPKTKIFELIERIKKHESKSK